MNSFFSFKRFAPTFPTEVMRTMLAYESNEICEEHLRSFGVIFSDDLTLIDCKSSRNNWNKK